MEKERKELQEIAEMAAELAKAKKYSDTIINNLPIPFWVKDVKGTYLLVNKEWEKQFNLGNKLVLGRKDALIWDEEVANQHRYHDTQVIEQKKTIFTKETVKDPRCGLLTTWYVIKFPFLGADGEVDQIGAFGIRINNLKDKGMIEDKCDE